MGQELIALNGNEQFPYQLTANDIANAMGLQNGVAPGGLSTNGIILLSSGDYTLDDTAWNNLVVVGQDVTSVTLPSTNPQGAVIWFLPNSGSTGDYGYSWTLNISSVQSGISCPAVEITSTNSVTVQANQSIGIVSSGTDVVIIGGTYLLLNNPGVLSFSGNIQIQPCNLFRTSFSNQNYLQNGSFLYGVNAGWVLGSNTTAQHGYNFYNQYVALSGPVNTLLSITSDNCYVSSADGDLLFSMMAINFGYDTSTSGYVTNTNCNATVSINYYDSSSSLLETQTLFTILSGSYWQLYVSDPIVFSGTTAATSYVTLTISLQSYPYSTNFNISQLKLERYNSFDLPTFFSDEASTIQYATNSFSGSGYQKLPSGLIMQWGLATNTGQSGSTPGTATFPLAFPNACFQVVMTDSGPGDFRYWTQSYTNTSFELGAMTTDAGGTATYVGSGSAVGRFIAYGW